MSLRNFLGYNTDEIIIWEYVLTEKKDDLGRPVKEWKKTVCKGKWENAIKVVRNMNGDVISSMGNAILPVCIDIKSEVLIEKVASNSEKTASNDEKPSSNARKIITFEEITQIGKQAEEWIYYI